MGHVEDETVDVSRHACMRLLIAHGTYTCVIRNRIGRSEASLTAVESARLWGMYAFASLPVQIHTHTHTHIYIYIYMVISIIIIFNLILRKHSDHNDRIWWSSLVFIQPSTSHHLLCMRCGTVHVCVLDVMCECACEYCFVSYSISRSTYILACIGLLFRHHL